MFNELKKAIVHNFAFYLCTFIALGLIITSFFLPPTGVIDPSVLAGAGEIWAFMGLWAVIHALNKGSKASVKHGNTEITVNDDKEEDQ